MSPDALDLAWEDLRRCFGLNQFKDGKFVASDASIPAQCSLQVTPETLSTLVNEGGGDAACRLVCAHLSKVIRMKIVPEFWKTMTDKEARPNAADRFSIAVNTLHK